VKVYTLKAEQIFDKPDSVKLKNQKLLNEAGQFIEGQNPVQVVIEASAGPKGDSDKDRELSDNRAYIVRGYLLDHFKLEDARLKILGLGKTEGEPSVRMLVYSRDQSQGR
jgi:outer membrane protein OmpA-like peptidoglycan-associated protein